MKILNYGSLNIDFVYNLDHFVIAGETISSQRLEKFCGGKGLNQSIALAHADADVYHAGKVGADGKILTDALKEAGVNTTYVAVGNGSSGHAIIQVNKAGNNCIILYGGTNRQILEREVDVTLKNFGKGDVLLLQNEINDLEYIMKKAQEVGMTIAFNPAPMENMVNRLPLNLVDYLIINEVEGTQVSGKTEPAQILDDLTKKYRNMAIVLTLGAEGVMYRHKDESHVLKPTSANIKVVDTTAAGDTFIGFFLAAITQGLSALTALKHARAASEICITREGASSSIPTDTEMQPIFKRLD